MREGNNVTMLHNSVVQHCSSHKNLRANRQVWFLYVKLLVICFISLPYCALVLAIV